MKIMKQFSFPNVRKSWPKVQDFIMTQTVNYWLEDFVKKTMILTITEPRILFFARQDATTLHCARTKSPRKILKKNETQQIMTTWYVILV
jgi:hypothetical protein